MTRSRRTAEVPHRVDRAQTYAAGNDRVTLARLAAHERWARVGDRTAATAAARKAADDRFIAQARRLHPGLAELEIRRRAENLRSAHAIRAARARWHRPGKDTTETR